MACVAVCALLCVICSCVRVCSRCAHAACIHGVGRNTGYDHSTPHLDGCDIGHEYSVCANGGVLALRLCCVNALASCFKTESSGLQRLIPIDKGAHEHARVRMHAGKQVRVRAHTHALEIYADFLYGARCYPNNLALTLVIHHTPGRFCAS